MCKSKLYIHLHLSSLVGCHLQQSFQIFSSQEGSAASLYFLQRRADFMLRRCVLQDTKGAVGKLEVIFALLIHALACLAYLAIFNVSQPALMPPLLTTFSIPCCSGDMCSKRGKMR